MHRPDPEAVGHPFFEKRLIVAELCIAMSSSAVISHSTGVDQLQEVSELYFYLFNQGRFRELWAATDGL